MSSTPQTTDKQDPTIDGGTISLGRSDESVFKETEAATDVNAGGIPPVNTPKHQQSRPKKLLFMLGLAGVLAAAGVGVNRCTQVAGEFKHSLKERRDSTQPQASESSSKFASARALPGAAASSPDAGSADAAAETERGDLSPVRGSDGKVLLGANGNPVAIDKSGQLQEVPPIRIATSENMGPGAPSKKPLPAKATTLPAQSPSNGPQARTAEGTQAAASPQTKQPSRYGGSLYADGTGASSGRPHSNQADTQSQPAAGADFLRQLLAMQSGGQKPPGSMDNTPFGFGSAADGKAGPSSPPGSIGQQLGGSSTPMIAAQRDRQPSLLMPKARQGDCTMTSRVINELPGFCSCVLAQDLYSSDGKVLLMERGSQLDGEYGIAGAIGNRRLFMVWNRARTPNGVLIDLQSPATDALGTSGVEGYLENRWFDRIGAAMMISVLKDVVAIEQAKRSPAATAGSQPYSNSVQQGQQLAEQVLKQTINIRPTLYINEGDRVAVFVARDIDFSGVYRLTTSRGGRP